MIKNVDFQQTVETAFLKYASNVAQERALPDVRDFLKIGLRQGLYAQFTNKLTHKDKFQKAQKSVAAAMAQSYVHGDVAMYDAFIRAARPWSSRYPLEDVQGSYGNPTSPDSHAAMRYVEMRASELSNCFFDGLKKNAIGEQWYWNYDDSEQIPSVFPSIGFWNIVNGCLGIAVAMSTSVPCFNLHEVNEALIKLIQNPDIDFNEIYCAPDFPTGGIITNATAVKESLRLGHGESIRIQAKLEYFPDQHMIKATQLPYSVFTNTIIDQLAELTTTNENYGIEKIVDHTKKEADIRIYLSKNVNVKSMIQKLYTDTSLENWYSINMVLLDKGRYPKIFGWREACNAYIAHIRECKYNICQFELDKALARLNIVEGLLIAAANIDEVVALIRSSENPTEAANKLIARFNFNEEQVKAILAMKLASLTKIDAIKLENEKAELLTEIDHLHYLINEPTALDAELINVLREVANKFGDTRRTQVIEKEIELIEPIEEKELGILLFDNNMIRLVAKDELQGGKRGKKGTSVKPPKNANLINTLYATNLSSISIITLSGHMYNLELNELDCNYDYSVHELINIQSTDKVLLLIDTTSFTSYHNLITITQQGFIKKSDIREYRTKNKKGISIAKIDTNDQLIGVYLSSSDNDKIMIASANGHYNYYPLSEISTTGRITKGVKAIKLLDDKVIGATIIRENIEYTGILSMSTKGQGKITALDEFTIGSRAIKGSQIMDLKDEQLALIYAVPTTQSSLFISANNKAVSLQLSNIPIQGRMTSGVRIINTTNAHIEVI